MIRLSRPLLMFSAAGLALLLALLAPYATVTAAVPPATPATRALAAPGQAALPAEADALRQDSKTLAAVIRTVLPAVVNIRVVKTVEADPRMPDLFNDPFFRRFFGPGQSPQQPEEHQQQGSGSGFIVSPDGYILTNNHVAGGADKITVILRDGRELQAKLVGADPGTDLAVIKIEADGLPVAHFGDATQLEVGETVIAIGNPFGLEQTVTQGIVSAKGRSKLGLSEYEDFIQTDASINPGNSGGPLIDVTGRVVGVNTAIFSRSGGNMGIGFAIPINLADEVMTALIKHGAVHRGFMGVSIQDVTPQLGQAMGVEPGQGVLVAEVQPDSPAARAGMRQGDVIVTFDGEPVHTANELRVRVAGVGPGGKAPVDVLREGARMTLNVTLIERQSTQATAQSGQPDASAPPTGAVERKLGLALQTLTPQIAEQLGYQGLQGALVAEVESGSVAEQAGLQRGALIQRVGRLPVDGPEALRAALAKAKSGDALLLLGRLGKSVRFIALKVP